MQRELRRGDKVEIFVPEFIDIIGTVFPDDDPIHGYMSPLTVDNPCDVGRDLAWQLKLFAGQLEGAAKRHFTAQAILEADENQELPNLVANARTIKAHATLWQFYCRWSNALILPRRATEDGPCCGIRGCILPGSPISSHMGYHYDGRPIPYPTLALP